MKHALVIALLALCGCAATGPEKEAQTVVLSDVAPLTTSCDVPYLRTGYPMPAGNANAGLTTSVSSADIENGARSKHGMTNRLSASRVAHDAALSGLIRHVVLVCAKEKVIGADTAGVVTFMTDKQWPRVDAMRQEPAKPVRPVRYAFELEGTVTSGEPVRRPIPAFAGLVDLAPETCNRFSIHGTSPAVGHDPGRANAAGSTRWSLS